MQKELLIRPVSDFKRVGNTKVALMRQNVAQSFSGGFGLYVWLSSLLASSTTKTALLQCL